MLWIDDKVEVIEDDQNPFLAEVKMLEAPFHSPHLGPIAIPEGYEEGGVEVCELTKEWCYYLRTSNGSSLRV